MSSTFEVSQLTEACRPFAGVLTNPWSPEQSYSKTTKAALDFFEASNAAATEDALNHLVAILFRACGSLFMIEEGMSESQAKRWFFEGWLLAKLLPYRTAGTFREAAQRGEFHNLGNQGRSALIDELLKRDRDALRRKPTRMDQVIDTDAKGYDVTLGDLISPSQGQKVACLLGKKPNLELSDLRLELERGRREFINKLGEPLFNVLSTVCDLFPDRLSLGDVTRAIAKARSVSEQTARKIHHELTSKLCSLRGEPVVRALVEKISRAGAPIFQATDVWNPMCQG